MVYKEVDESEKFTYGQLQMRPRYFSSRMRQQELFTNLAKVEIVTNRVYAIGYFSLCNKSFFLN